MVESQASARQELHEVAWEHVVKAPSRDKPTASRPVSFLATRDGGWLPSGRQSTG